MLKRIILDAARNLSDAELALLIHECRQLDVESQYRSGMVLDILYKLLALKAGHVAAAA
jgi:hypothetical protein